MSSSAEPNARAGFPRSTAPLPGLEDRAARSAGPRIVAFGGGTGMAALLTGLKRYSDNVTAVVTVTDNGGSSGRLRHDFDMAAPGDIRNCLMALADVDPLIAKAFQYRFDEAEFKGHCFGNLFITVMSRVVDDFGASIRELNRLLNVRGRVLPATSTKVSLVAQHPDGTKSTGEVQITKSGKRIQRVEIRPRPIELSDEIRGAVREADLFVFGPGSLYTSVIPNLLIDGLVDEINRRGRPRLYICNIMTQPGETDGYALSDHLRALRSHVGVDFPDAVVAHAGPIPSPVVAAYRESGAEPVRCDIEGDAEFDGIRLITENFFFEGEAERRGPASEDVGEAPVRKGTARHDSSRLARVIHEEFLRPLEAAATSRADDGAEAR